MNLVDSCGWLEYFADSPQADFYAAALRRPGVAPGSHHLSSGSLQTGFAAKRGRCRTPGGRGHAPGISSTFGGQSGPASRQNQL